MDETAVFSLTVDENDAGERLDVVIARHLDDCSRSMAAGMIRSKAFRINRRGRKPGYRVKFGDALTGSIPPPPAVNASPEPIPIDLRYEDEHLLVINKPAGLVVHPAPGHFTGTLVNALLHRFPDLGSMAGTLRPGIVHRLDKDTSGTLVVAKTVRAQHALAEQFKSRKVKKTYLAIVHGDMAADAGIIELPIGRHPMDRKRMSTTSRKTRDADTRWRVRERFGGACLLEVDLKTGRTHQIRVHCAAEGHPVAGDAVYGKKSKKKGRSPSGDTPGALLSAARRQMLHAWRISFTHPETQLGFSIESPLPEDMAGLLQALRSAGSPGDPIR